jgi:hypothetical protein
MALSVVICIYEVQLGRWLYGEDNYLYGWFLELVLDLVMFFAIAYFSVVVTLVQLIN